MSYTIVLLYKHMPAELCKKSVKGLTMIYLSGKKINIQLFFFPNCTYLLCLFIQE